MFRTQFQVLQLEDRTNPVSLTFSASFGLTAAVQATVPPTDPMDNPPPVQPAPTGGSNTGTTTPPAPPAPPVPPSPVPT